MPRSGLTKSDLFKANISAKTMRLLKTHLPSADFQGLQPEREFWSGEKTLSELRGRKYLSRIQPEDDDDFDAEAGEDQDEEWPDAVKDAARDPLLMSTFGGLIWYLRSLKLERQLLSLRNFAAYDPLRRSGTLVLDSQTLINLDVLHGADGSEKGSLFEVLNRCATPMGKRLLKRWMCHPLRNADDINARLDAVDDFLETEGMLEGTDARFRRLPDVERAISRIHAGTCRPKDFLATLDALEDIHVYFVNLAEFADGMKSTRIQKLAAEAFPDSLKEKLNQTRDSFEIGTGEGSGGCFEVSFRRRFRLTFSMIFY